MPAVPAPDDLRATADGEPARRTRPSPGDPLGQIAAWPSKPQRLVSEPSPATGIDDPLHWPALSVVVPAYNEAGNLSALIHEIVTALSGHTTFEILIVDDASDDATCDELRSISASVPALRVLRHAHRSGQSAALRAGVRAARGAWIATLDGDGQNDPADIPVLMRALDAASLPLGMVCGWRVDRRDGSGKRWASRLANGIRRTVLRDDTPDTGCGIKLFERSLFLQLPDFDHMHRYLPALAQRAGARTCSVPVNHRPRTLGVSKYGNVGRALVGITDLAGVAWLMRRSRPTPVQEL